MSQPVVTGSALLAAMLVLAGCGGSSHRTTANVTATSGSAGGGGGTGGGGGAGPGAKTFSVRGMAVRFTYPSGFRVVRLAESKRIAGNTARASHAAVGIGVYDLLIVTRFPNRPTPVTAQNINKLKPQFDAAISSALGRRVASTIETVGGLPALAYPPAPVVGLPIKATSRITEVFVGDDEYELNCQYTPKAAARIAAACDQMLATLRVGG
jgi:hypothetical protein